MSEPDVDRKNLRVTVIGVVVMVAAVGVVLFSGGTDMITKPLIESRLQSFAETLSSDAKERGAEVDFKYDGVEVKGWLFGKKAIISNPSITFTRSGPFRKDVYVFSTMSVVAEADNMTGANLNIRFPAPFTISSADKPLAKLKFEGEPLCALIRSHGASGSSLSLPPKLTVSSEGKDNVGVTVTYDPSPTVMTAQKPDGSRNGAVSFRNIRVVDLEAKKEVLSVGSLSSEMSEKPAENGKTMFDSLLSVNDVGIKTAKDEAGPYSLKISSEGTMVKPVAAMTASPTRPEVDMTLREAKFVADKFEIHAKGNVSRRPDDILPYGSVDIVVQHFQKMLESKLVSSEARPMLLSIASAVSGAPAEQAQDLQFNVHREKAGTLMVGRVSFEELMMYMMSQVKLKPAAAGAFPAVDTHPAEPAIIESAPAPDAAVVKQP